MAGQVAYHLLAQAGTARAPWPVTTIVSCLPVLVLAMGTTLAHMLRAVIGALHLAPSWIFEGHDSILAVDIGGTNIRCGVVETRWKKTPDLSKASVWKSELWRHADDEPTREGAVKRLVKMLKDLIADAEAEGLKLAPFIGIACPGVIDADGSIEKGAQNLPGNWESSRFNLPASLVEAIPQIGDHDTAVLMHNDGVVQGL